MTETSGFGMYSVSFSTMAARSSAGVRPAAWMSLSRGSEILPSGRTGVVRLMVVLFQTAMSRRSSGPMRYSAAFAPASPPRTEADDPWAHVAPGATSARTRPNHANPICIFMMTSVCGRGPWVPATDSLVPERSRGLCRPGRAAAAHDIARAAPAKRRASTFPFRDGDRGPVRPVGDEIEFVHEAPDARQPHAETPGRGVPVLQRAVDVLDARSLVARGDHQARAHLVLYRSQDDFAPRRVEENVAPQLRDRGGDAGGLARRKAQAHGQDAALLAGDGDVGVGLDRDADAVSRRPSIGGTEGRVSIHRTSPRAPARRASRNARPSSRSGRMATS